MSDVPTNSFAAAFSLAREVPRQNAANLFELRPGTIRPLGEVSEDSGDVPVRCEEWQHFPHIDMTHTETALHVDPAGPFIGELSWPVVVRATVATISVSTLGSTGESGPSNSLLSDWVISSAAIDEILTENGGALVIFARTPDADERPHCPAYFTHEAMRRIAERNVQHLLFSEFSVDRADDTGELHNHRAFWNLPLRDSTAASLSALRASATITENIARPERLLDGEYLLVLNPMPAMTDASPSAPLLLKRSE